MSRLISFAEVRSKGWIVVGDDVYDITKFAAKHPGGSEIVHLRGSDATFPLINAHGIRGELPSLPKKLCVGQIDPPTLRPVDRDLRELWAQLRRRGMFEYKRWWFLLDLVRGLGFFVCGWLAMDTSPVLAFCALLVARLNVMWWVHDLCHDSVFKDRKMARRWAEMMSILFVGTSVTDYQYVVHRKHHGFTNTIGADQAIETGPVVWHELMRTRTADTFVPIQSWFWFVVVLPMTLPYFIYIGLRHCLRERAYWSLLGVIARWTIALWLFSDHLFLFLVPSFVSAYVLGLTASLNHFHRPMSEIADWNFARSVTCVTQNLGATNRISAWLVGGLSFHIEHHFFATMPRRNYRRIAPEIRAFCERNHLPYTSVSIPQALAALWHKLRRPFDDNAPPSRPSMDLHRGG
ncbi:MAG: fatty acid desaturase 2-like [Myxococcales bacterium]|nr:fatty acid desaturase 2-like [Myxococcales bacterium]